MPTSSSAAPYRIKRSRGDDDGENEFHCARAANVRLDEKHFFSAAAAAAVAVSLIGKARCLRNRVSLSLESGTRAEKLLLSKRFRGVVWVRGDQQRINKEWHFYRTHKMSQDQRTIKASSPPPPPRIVSLWLLLLKRRTKDSLMNF